MHHVHQVPRSFNATHVGRSPKTATSALLEGYFKECGIQKPESPFCLVWLKVEDPSHVAWVASKWSEYTVSFA